MIRADVIETIRREFPGVTILRNDDPLPGGRLGFGVELADQRTAWLLADTPEQWSKLLDAARRWLTERHCRDR
jgi:hypothetical protein